MKLFFFLRQSKMVNHDLANSKYFLDVCCKLHAQHRLWSPVWSHDEDLDRPNGSQLLAREDYPGDSQEYMANTHMAKANKYQVHRKGGKVADNVFFAEVAMMGV